MDLNLRYLIIIRPNGLPIFSQSFDFEAVFACRTFNNRLSEMGEKKELLSGYFNAIKDILAEVVRDRLRVINLGFQSYRMAGIVFEGFLYLGVFEIPYKESMNVGSEIIDLLGKIADCFTQKYQESLLYDDLVDLSEFEDFSKDLLRLGLPLSMDKCRNCLVDCVDENMGCLPHLIFFQEI